MYFLGPVIERIFGQDFITWSYFEVQESDSYHRNTEVCQLCNHKITKPNTIRKKKSGKYRVIMFYISEIWPSQVEAQDIDYL